MNQWTNPVPTGKPLHLHELGHPDSATKDAAKATDAGFYNSPYPNPPTFPPLNLPPFDLGSGQGIPGGMNFARFVGNLLATGNVAGTVSIDDIANNATDVAGTLDLTPGTWIVLGQVSGDFTSGTPFRVFLSLETEGGEFARSMESDPQPD